jgi:hypothetical protein
MNVGTSGWNWERVRVVTAIARTRPAFKCDCMVAIEEKFIAMRPETRSGMTAEGIGGE